MFPVGWLDLNFVSLPTTCSLVELVGGRHGYDLQLNLSITIDNLSGDDLGRANSEKQLEMVFIGAFNSLSLSSLPRVDTGSMSARLRLGLTLVGQLIVCQQLRADS